MCWNLFFLLGPLCACVAYLAVVRPLGLAPAARWWAGLCLAAFSLKFTWFSLAGGSKFVPEMPEWTIHVLSVPYDFVLILAALGVAWAIARQVAPRRRERPGTEGGNGFTRRRVIAGALACVASGTSVKGVYDGRRLPDVVEVPLEFPDLPPEFDGYRVAQISDLHVSAAARADRTAGVVRLVNACDPDLIAITGDVVDGMAERRMDDVAPLAGLRARDGVVGCTGNHEYYGSGWNRWRVIFRDLGMRVLENERMLLRRGDATLAILGENDPVSRDSGIHAAAALVPDGAFRILLAHRPTRLAEHAACGVRLQLSGHTHGGAVLGIDRLVAQANEGHVRGLYREHGMSLYVNSGTGQWAGFPTRLGVCPEISLLVLRRQSRG